MPKMFKADSKRHFEEIAKNYNSIINKRPFRHYLKRRKEYLKEFCASGRTNKVILDLAAGTGSYTKSLSNYSYLINADLSFQALKINDILSDKAAKINADALNIPLKNNSVDSILLIGLLHHIPHYLPQLFQELLRVLKNGGAIFIDEPNGYNVIWFIYMRLCEIDKVGAFPIFPCSLRKLTRDYCLTIERTLYWGFIPPWPDKKFIIDIFKKIESIMENSFLACLCMRYLMILKKEEVENENY